MRYTAMLVLVLLMASAFVAPQQGISAQPNCFIAINDIGRPAGTYYYRAVIGSTVISEVKSATLTAAGNVNLTLAVNPGVSGVNAATAQRSTSPTFSPLNNLLQGSFSVNCTNNNREFGGGCGTLGVDIAGVDLQPNSTATLYVIGPGGAVVFEKSYSSGGSFTKLHIQEPLPAAYDHTATYSYALYCTAGTCAGQGGIPMYSAPALLVSGPLTYLCPPPCGPSLDGAPLGRMLTTVPLHWAPSAASASTFSAEAGKTFKIIGSQDGFTRIALACQAYWVPSASIAQCADPLCRD